MAGDSSEIPLARCSGRLSVTVDGQATCAQTSASTPWLADSCASYCLNVSAQSSQCVHAHCIWTSRLSTPPPLKTTPKVGEVITNVGGVATPRTPLVVAPMVAQHIMLTEIVYYHVPPCSNKIAITFISIICGCEHWLDKFSGHC